MASWNLQSDENIRSQVEPDPRPQRREKASREGWEAIRRGFAGQTCVCCGLGDQLELHHVLPRSQSGSDVPENLCVLCRSCHTKLESHAPGWERVAGAIRQYVITDPARLRYQNENAPGFSNRYPPLPHPEAERIARDFKTINDRKLTVSRRRERECDPWSDDQLEVEGHGK
jgi:hypothetical protein